MDDHIAELTKDPRRGLLKLAWPVIVSMLFSTLLQFVDFIFVGGLGPDALAGVQLSFPLFFLIIAISSGVTIGTTSLIARRLGENNKLWAEETGMHALILAGVLSLIFTTLVLFVDPMAASLGAGPGASAMAADYLRVFFAGVFVFFILYTMQAILQGEGDTKTPMKLAILYTLLNIVLDPIFIYTLHMGVGGAAFATVLSAAVSLVIYIWYVIVAKKSYLKIHPREFVYTPQIIKNILKVGLPAAASQIGLSIAVFGVNLLLAGFGDLAISAYGIGFRVDSLAILPMLGLAAGVIPLIGYYRGANDYEGARKVSRLAVKIVLASAAVTGAAIFLLSGVLPGMFASDPAVIAMASDYMRIIVLSYPFIGMAIVLSSSFQGLGRGMPSLVLTMTRAVVIVLPLCYYLAYYTDMRVSGVWWGIVISTVLTAIFAFTWIEGYYRKLLGGSGVKAPQA